MTGSGPGEQPLGPSCEAADAAVVPSRATFDESRLLALGEEIRGAQRGRTRRHRKYRWILGTAVVAVVLVLGGAAGYAWYLNHEIHRIDLRNLTSAPRQGGRRRHGEHPHDRFDRPVRPQGAEPGLRAVLARVSTG